MKTAFSTLILVATAGLLAGCQTSMLKPESGNATLATVKHPIFWGDTRITVLHNGKSYTGVAGELIDETTDERADSFGWKPGHRHPNIKQEMKFQFGTTTLTANDGTLLVCAHMKHGDNWRLRCSTTLGEEIKLYPFKQ